MSTSKLDKLSEYLEKVKQDEREKVLDKLQYKIKTAKNYVGTPNKMELFDRDWLFSTIEELRKQEQP